MVKSWYVLYSVVYRIHDSVPKNCWVFSFFVRLAEFAFHLQTRPITGVIFFFPIGTVVYDKLCAALTNNALVKGIKQASPLAQTSCLEGFHSVLNHFALILTSACTAGTCRLVVLLTYIILMPWSESYSINIYQQKLNLWPNTFIRLDLFTEVYSRSYRVNSSPPLPLMLL